MRDPRYRELAKLLIHHSVSLQPGEKLLIDSTGGETDLTRELVKAAYEAGGLPFVHLSHGPIRRELMKGMTEEQAAVMAEYEIARMKAMDAYIGVHYSANPSDGKGIPAEKVAMLTQKVGIPVHLNIRVNETKWCEVKVPSPSMAQKADMPTEEFADFLFKVCTVDYQKMSAAMQPLEDLMSRTDKVRIVGPGTDLTFSIQGIPAIKCDGKNNIPDGEVYTAPVKDSANGVLQFNAPTIYNGHSFDNIRLVFEHGKIVEATSNDTVKLNEILDLDEGARYLGEFAIGVNPHILEPMRDILFDEKIAGSFHLTPGCCYDDAPNGNKSGVHWDMVCIQRPEYGGGEIWFDDVLIRKDGLFVVPELLGLNPENLT